MDKFHQPDAFIEEMLRTTWAAHDARKWFARKSRCLFEFDRSETDGIVDFIYAAGANDVQVVGEPEVIARGKSIDMILVHLPDNAQSRKQLFELSGQVAKDTGYDGDVDNGQRYMLLRWT
jgi:hypothetical protein